MKYFTMILSVLVILIGRTEAQDADPLIKAVTETALDYADGYYSGASERMERAIHPDLNKLSVVKINPAAKSALQYSTYSGLIEITRAKLGFREPEKRNIEVKVLKTNENIASVKVKSAMFNDYLQMVKIDDHWKIVNVLWEPGPETPNLPPAGDFNIEHESQWVKTVVTDYYTGSFESDVAKMEKSIHPEMRAGQFVKLPQNGKEFINRVGPGIILEATRAKLRQIPEDQRKVEVNLLDITEKMAYLEAITPMSVNYLHLAKMENEWKIVNILGRQNPPPGR